MLACELLCCLQLMQSHWRPDHQLVWTIVDLDVTPEHIVIVGVLYSFGARIGLGIVECLDQDFWKAWVGDGTKVKTKGVLIPIHEKAARRTVQFSHMGWHQWTAATLNVQG